MAYVNFMRKLEGKPEIVVEDRPSWTSEELLRVAMIGDVEPIMDILEGGRSWEDLDIAFSWSSTPQGHHYWDSICVGRTSPTEDDISFLEALLEVHS